MDRDGDRLGRVARAICEQALFERHGFPPVEADVDWLSGNFVGLARAAILAADGDAQALAADRRRRAMWSGILAP